MTGLHGAGRPEVADADRAKGYVLVALEDYESGRDTSPEALLMALRDIVRTLRGGA